MFVVGVVCFAFVVAVVVVAFVVAVVVGVGVVVVVVVVVVVLCLFLLFWFLLSPLGLMSTHCQVRKGIWHEPADPSRMCTSVLVMAIGDLCTCSWHPCSLLFTAHSA